MTLTSRNLIVRVGAGAIALAAIALTLALLAAAPARAGSYDVWSCRDAAGQPLPASGWALTTRGAAPGEVEVDDDCSIGGGLELRAADQAVPGIEGTLTFAAPSGASISGYELDRYMTAAVPAPGYNHVFTVATRERSATAESESACASVLALPNWNCSAEGDRDDPAAAANAVVRTGLALDGVQLRIACVLSSCDRPLIGPGALVRLWRARITLDDVSPPAAPQLSGSLLAGVPLDRSGALVVESADDGGGIAAMTLSVDGGLPQTIAPAGPHGSCALPYTTPQPCPSAAARSFEIDTSALAEGAHSAAGTVTDAAGNVTPYGPVSFAVAHPVGRGGTTPPLPPVDPTPPTPPAPPAPTPAAGNGVPAVTTPRLRLDRTALVRAGSRAARVGGTLRTPGGAPIAGARLTVAATDLGTAAAARHPLAVVVTGADGRFSVVLPARSGASGAERLEVAFAPTDAAAPTAVATAVVRANATVTATRSKARLRRGQAVVIGGRLERVGAAAKGAVVELQAVVRGDWRTVATVVAGADGRYRWRYRFVNTTRDTIFSFRALVRSSPGWPWPELRSRRLLVRVDAN